MRGYLSHDLAELVRPHTITFMTTIELLRKQVPVLARKIEAFRESELRKVAAVIAEAAVRRTGLSDPVINEAVERLKAFPTADAELQARVEAVAEDLDEKYFTLKEPLEEREDAGKTDPAVILAFSKARAASAVAAALGEDAGQAAARAGYEGFFACGEADYLIEALRRSFTK